jgi:hypothetical protein
VTKLITRWTNGKQLSVRVRRNEDREVGWGDVEWIGMARDRDRWGALVNAVMNLMNLMYLMITFFFFFLFSQSLSSTEIC